MSELARSDEEWLDIETTERNFELIKNSFDRAPEGPFFSAVWNFPIDIHDLTSRRYLTELEQKANKEALKANRLDDVITLKPIITSGKQLVTEIFQQVELLQEPERLSEFKVARTSLMQTHENGSPETEHFIFESLDRFIKIHEVVKPLLDSAFEYYYSGAYWSDPDHRSGLLTENLEILFALTDQYEHQGLLGVLKQIEATGGFDENIISEANRIARILVAREVNAIE